MATEQHVREGRVERAIREHLAAHPDGAFTTDDLCVACYPGVPRVALAGSETLGRKHRVAVLRAADKVMSGDSNWRRRHTRNERGNMLVFFNAASIPSTAKADVMRNGWNNRWKRNAEWDEPDRLAEAERHVAEHTIMRDGTDEQRQQMAERKAAERTLRTAKLHLAVAVAKNPMGVLLNANRLASGNMKELAEKARALMVENDPDAIRDGLAEIAKALDGMASEAEDPMVKVQEMLA
jgi:hypothetical protein